MMCEGEAIRHGHDNDGRDPINCHLIGFARIGCNHDIVTTMPRIKPFAPVSLTYRRRMLTVRRRLGLLAEVISNVAGAARSSSGQLMGYAAAGSAGARASTSSCRRSCLVAPTFGGLQCRSRGRKVPGGFDSHPPPLRWF